MNNNHLNTKIREFILKKFPLGRRKGLNDSDGLLETGIVDSLGVLQIVTFIEEEFLITVADEDLVPENFQSIERLAAFVRNKTSHKG